VAEARLNLRARSTSPSRLVRARRGAAELLFVAPILLIVGVVIGLPTLSVVRHSFTAWDPGFTSPWIGLDNFATLLESEQFQQILVNQATLLLGLPVWVLLPLLVAFLLHDGVPAPGLFRALFFFPATASPALIGILFTFLLAPTGPINEALRGIGLGALAHSWLAEPGLVKPVLIGVLAWATLGTGVVIFAAAAGPRPRDRALDGDPGDLRLRRRLPVDLHHDPWRAGLRDDHDRLRHLPERPQLRLLRPGRGGVRDLALDRPRHRRLRRALGPPGRSPGMSAGRRWSKGRTVIAIVIAIPFVYPFIFLVGTALKTSDDFYANPAGLPSSLTLRNVDAAWSEAELGPAMVRSAIAVGLAVIVTVVISVAGAAWFMRHHGRVASALRWAVIGTMAVPVPVFIIPLFLQFNDWGIGDNLVSLAFVFAAWNASFGLYLTHAYLQGLPRDVLEAADLDGASPFQQLRHIIVPLSRPVLATLAVLSFVWSWSDLLIAVVIVQDPAMRLLIPSTALLSDRFVSNVPANAAGVVIALVPILLVFLVGQRALVRGITAGVGK
jgi:ABC-type glycerol-3-phosphate transport system permease component